MRRDEVGRGAGPHLAEVLLLAVEVEVVPRQHDAHRHVDTNAVGHRLLQKIKIT